LGSARPASRITLRTNTKEYSEMGRSLNKVMLIGNVGSEPEIRATASGNRVAKLSLATNRQWKDGSGQKQEKTEWHRLTFFGRLVDIVEQWVKKGDRLYAEGRVEYSQTEKDGQTKYWTDVVVSEMVMLGSTADGGGGGGGGGGSGAPQGQAPPAPISEPDDDLPF
jgi:single-strand DNA-binding protein